MKQCLKCKKYKEEFYFSKSKSHKNGLNSWCKECCNKRYRIYYEKNKERERERKIEWAKNNPEKNRQKYRKWASINPDKIKDKDAKFYLENKEKIIEDSIEWKRVNPEKAKKINERWAKNNPEKVKANRDNQNNKRRALYNETDIDSSYLISLKEESVYCPLCEVKMDEIRYSSKQKHLDHIIPLNIGGTHSKNNVRYICAKCNLHRSKKRIE